MANWQHCIVTFIDVVGIKSLASSNDGAASRKMRELHSLGLNYASQMMPLHAHTYLWNDSALLLAYVEQDLAQAPGVMKEANDFKKAIDDIGECYAISVKGKVFPDLNPFAAPVFGGQISDQPRATVIKASSFAMANCFLIEENLGKLHQKTWSVDCRIARCLSTLQKYTEHQIELLPGNKSGTVRLYEGNLW